ncbi:MAG: S24/S26 family peptidase [Candidatus Cryptobacteroides sp.]
MIVPNDILFAEISELLKEGKTVNFKVKGVSMLPFIVGDRDSVSLKDLPFEEGDAVLAQLPSSVYVLHRVLKIDGDKVTLKGDGNLQGTEHCRLEDVKGKVLAVLKKGERVEVDTSSYKKRVRRWNSLPYIIRRIYLAIYRRIVL